MMMRAAATLLGLGLGLGLGLSFTGCARVPAGTGSVPPGAAPDAAAEAGEARAAVALFLTLEARGNADADTLLAPGADFLLTGVRVTTRPRLAALNGAGQAFIEEAGITLASPFAWVVAGYRFEGRTPDLADRARATFILEKQRAGWRIRHVHSSSVARW